MTQTSSDTGLGYLCFIEGNSFFHSSNVALTHLSCREACRNNTMVMCCMISHHRHCGGKEAPIRTETGHFWGRKWEQDGEKSASGNKCTMSDGESCRSDLGWDEHECHSSHTGADGCYLLWTAILNMALCETACCKDKGSKWKCQSV